MEPRWYIVSKEVKNENGMQCVALSGTPVRGRWNKNYGSYFLCVIQGQPGMETEMAFSSVESGEEEREGRLSEGGIVDIWYHFPSRNDPWAPGREVEHETERNQVT